MLPKVFWGSTDKNAIAGDCDGDGATYLTIFRILYDIHMLVGTWKIYYNYLHKNKKQIK